MNTRYKQIDISADRTMIKVRKKITCLREADIEPKFIILGRQLALDVKCADTTFARGLYCFHQQELMGYKLIIDNDNDNTISIGI